MYISIFCESVYDLEYGRKSEVSVYLLVPCVVQKKKKKVHPIRGHESPHVEWQNSFIH